MTITPRTTVREYRPRQNIRLRDRPGGSRPLPGAIEETSQALTDDSLGIRHDAVDQFLHRRNVVNEPNDHAAAPRARVHVAVDHHLGIDARHLLVDVVNLQAFAFRSLDFDQVFDALVVQYTFGIA